MVSSKSVGVSDFQFESPFLGIWQVYDEMVEEILSVRINLKEGDRYYEEEELLLMGLNDLKLILSERQRWLETDSLPELRRLVRNSQRVPISTPSAIEFGDPKYIFGRVYKNYDPSLLAPDRVFFPVISLHRYESRPDTTRFNTSTVRKLSWVQSFGEVIQTPRPLPRLLNYQVEILTTKIHHMNTIDQTLQERFGDSFLRVVVDHGEPWGKIPVSVNLDVSYQDTSTIDGESEQARRIMRHIYQVQVAGWMPRSWWRTKTVKTVGFSFESRNEKLFDRVIDLRD